MSDGGAMDLKGLVRSQIIDTVVRAVDPESGWKLLVVDSVALRMISACCTMSDLTDNDVTIVEDLQKSRQPHPDMDAIYICCPTVANAKAIEADFTPKPMYKAAHVFFVDAAEDAVIAAVGRSAALKPNVRTLSELNLNFVPREDRVFTLDAPDGLGDWYHGGDETFGGGAGEAAAKIASVCGALGVVPQVRYTASSAKCHDLAKRVQARVQALAAVDDGMSTACKAQVLIVDRGEDLAAPLVHELTYQCAVYDLMSERLDGDIITHDYTDGGGHKRSRRMVLGDHDEVWDELRHTHVDVVGAKVSASFKKFQADNAAADLSAKGDQAALREMMVRAPQRQEKMAMFSLHITLVSNIVDAAFRPFTKGCVDVEQRVLTGRDAEDQKVKDPAKEVEKLFAAHSGGATVAGKIRALGCCVVGAGGLPKDELDKLCAAGGLGGRRAAIDNMAKLGATVSYDGKARPYKPRSRPDTGNPALTKYATSRWTPVVKDFMVGAVTGSLETRAYPTVTGQSPHALHEVTKAERVSSSRDRRWRHQSQAEAAESKVKNKLIVFVPGAVSLNEIRCAHEVAEKFDVDVFIGSHTVLTPDNFVEKLEAL